jgi:hypothetical protein
VGPTSFRPRLFALNAGDPGRSIASVRELRRQPLGELVKFDDNPSVRASAYFLRLVHRPNTKFYVSAGCGGDFGKGSDSASDRSRRQVADLNACAHSALARFEVGLDRIQCSVLHGHDHDWSREHCGKRCVLEPIGEVLSGNYQRE